MFDGSIIQLYIEGLNKLKLNNLKNNLETVMIYDIKQKVKTYAEINIASRSCLHILQLKIK